MTLRLDKSDQEVTSFCDFAAANLVLSDGKTNTERLRRLTPYKEFGLIHNYPIKSLLLLVVFKK